VSNQEALDFINAYFKKFPQIKDYMNSTITTCRKQGYVSNIFGRRIHLRGINDKNFSIRSFQERAAINAPIQGSAADMTKKSMLDFYKEGIVAHIQIHDELDLSIEDDKQAKRIVEIMENAVTLEVPNKVDYEFGKNWGDIYD